MDAYDVIRNFLLREQWRQNALTDQIRSDLAAAANLRTDEESLVRINSLARRLHDASVVETYLGGALAGYPARQRTEAGS